ncbi:MAG TPA: DUF2232 domain-containing protein, partial [Solirubrobacterales bacterium]|nr:DUF2232 domain-containing protein [Solirubrobacterales bacterium]
APNPAEGSGTADMVFSIVGIGAGLVSALLFTVVAKGAPLAVVLSVVLSLPIFIAALGWNHRAGLVATAAGALALTFAFKLSLGMTFAVGWGLPAWWLAYLALLGRPRPDGSGANGALEWYPIGKLLFWAALAAALIALALAAAIGGGDHAAYRDAMRGGFEALLRNMTRTPAEAPLPPVRGIPAEDLVNGFVAAAPFGMAWSFALVLVINLWLAGRIVAISQRLVRPWPFTPATALPRLALGALAGAVLLAFLPGFPGVAGIALAGALGAAFALQGLAFVHDTTQGKPGRGALIAATWFLAIAIGHIAWPLLALAGLADAAIGLRKRLPSGGPGPRST